MPIKARVIALMLLVSGCVPAAQPKVSAAVSRAAERPVVLTVAQWSLRGDLLIAPGKGPRPAALLLNKAAGDRRAYEGLAAELAKRGISSLRLDLRGHGESINSGKFVPGAEGATDLLAGTDEDVAAALRFLRANRHVDGSRLAVVGASYSAEYMAEAARRAHSYARAYVALSPGSFSEESAKAIDPSGAKWLVTRSAREKSPAVKAAVEQVQARSKTGEVWVLDASTHATDVLGEVPGLDDRLAEWIAASVR